MANQHASVDCEVRGGVGRITLNRPPLNILDIAMMHAINGALESLTGRGDLKLLVIDHEHSVFSAGVDIKDHTGDKVGEMIRVFHRMFRLLAAVEVPTLAVVRGAALGGGCELATFCDLVVASDEASFGQPEIHAGVFPPIAAVILPGLVGRNRALELLLSGRTIGAEEAARIGLINRVFDADGFQAKVDEFISQIRSRSAAVLRLTKRAVDRTQIDSIDRAISQVEAIYLDELMHTEDAHEGLAAFLEKRKPEWKDR